MLWPDAVHSNAGNVDVAALARAFRRQRRTASPGVDRVTVDEYEQALESNLQPLHARVHSGRRTPISTGRKGERVPEVPGGYPKDVTRRRSTRGIASLSRNAICAFRYPALPRSGGASL